MGTWILKDGQDGYDIEGIGTEVRGAQEASS